MFKNHTNNHTKTANYNTTPDNNYIVHINELVELTSLLGFNSPKGPDTSDPHLKGLQCEPLAVASNHTTP